MITARCLFLSISLLLAMNAGAQPRSRSASEAPAPTNSAAGYASDLAVVRDSQQQALDQARESLGRAESASERQALQNAISEMERAQKALADAQDSPGKLPAAIAAEQAAYQALLKANSREYRMSRTRDRNSQNNRAGQANRRQMDQLDMQSEENRYETESQAQAPRNASRNGRVQTADRLKELSQRQQDVNERLRELQTSLQAARDEREREDLQRQLKRLHDEQRQLMANVDEMRQQLEQSPDAGDQSETRRQLEQTRADMERAAGGMERQSPSEALAAGARAQERMRNMRDELRSQSSSQFSDQMRDLRDEARLLRRQQDEISRSLNSMSGNDQQRLDNAAERSEIVKQLNQQRGALTNMLANAREVTEQSETLEPLLSKQLYDTLRRASQMRNEELIEDSAKLTEVGLLSQAAQAGRILGTNVAELAGSVERAADSILGSEADALRFADKELEDLTRQIERELAGGATNSASSGGNATNSPSSRQEQGNREQAQAGSRRREGRGARQDGSSQGGGANAAEYGANSLRQLAEQLGRTPENNGPITGSEYVNWADRLRDVERAVDPADIRNQLANARERASALRSEYRRQGRAPDTNVLRQEILMPMTRARVWLREELARKEQPAALAPLDRDAVPDNYAELVKKYYENLGSAR